MISIVLSAWSMPSSSSPGGLRAPSCCTDGFVPFDVSVFNSCPWNWKYSLNHLLELSVVLLLLMCL